VLFMKKFGVLALVLVFLFAFSFVAAEGFSWNVGATATGTTTTAKTYSTIEVRNPDGAGGPHLTGNDGCTKNGHDGCDIVVSGALAGHDNNINFPLNADCARIFPDSRHDRPVLILKCYNDGTATSKAIAGSGSNTEAVTLADEIKDFGVPVIVYVNYAGTATNVAYTLTDNSDNVTTWFSDGGTTTTNPLATIMGCLDADSDGECDYLDKDNDGYNQVVDCNDSNAAVNPGATEVCDDIDNNCVGGIDEDLMELVWRDMNGEEIGESDLKDTLQMVATCTSSGSFSIYEEDDDLFGFLYEDDDGIRVDGDSIEGVVKGRDLVGLWTITKDDLRKTPGDYEDFRFVVGENISESLEISGWKNDDKMIISLENPICGSSFDVGSTEQIKIVASDADDEITGSLSILGIEAAAFGNEEFILEHPFGVSGNIQIIADANNTRGKRSRSVSSIMVLDRSANGKYSAACIDSPKNFEDFDGSSIPIDASTSRAVQVTGSGANVEVVYPGDLDNRLNWYWIFSNGETRNLGGAAGRVITAYDFTVEFPTPGGNWATLKLDLN